MIRLLLTTIVYVVLTLAAACSNADVLPPGHKNVNHRMVFEASPALEKTTLLAAPTAGFKGICVIKPGQSFHFSTKYGTRIYALPDDVEIPKQFDAELFQRWPFAKPPRNEIKSVPSVSPIASALTTVRLKESTAAKPVLEMVDHVEYDRFGKEITWLRILTFRGIPLLLGIAICVILFRLVRTKRKNESISEKEMAA